MTLTIIGLVGTVLSIALWWLKNRGKTKEEVKVEKIDKETNEKIQAVHNWMYRRSGD